MVGKAQTTFTKCLSKQNLLGMYMMKKLGLIMFTIFLTNTLFAQSQLARIYGVQTGFEGVTFQVPSGGCTYKKDFQIGKQQARTTRGDSILKISLIHTGGNDTCEAFLPYGSNISFSWQELGLSTGSLFVIENRIGPVFVK